MQVQEQKVLVPNIFQYEALQELEKAQSERNKGVVIMPTGTGKTFLAALWFKKQLSTNPDYKLLFICHNKDILSQANEKEFQTCLKDLDITYGYYNAFEKNIQQATFATVQTLSRNLDKFNISFFDYIIIDEAHHYQANSFKKVANYFNPKFLLGLTATPYRKDMKDIFKVCGKPIYKATISNAIKKDLLTKIKYYCVDNDIDFSNVKWNGNNYDEKDLNKKICVKEYDEAILKEYNDNVKVKHNKKKTICFCATVEHCYRMEKLFNDNNIHSVALTAKKKNKSSLWSGTRDKIINGFKEGKYEVIFVRDLFNEGVDVPDADCVMMLRPIQSHTIFTQQIGRGLRKATGKEYLLILDFTGNARRCIINFEVLGDMIELNIIQKIRDITENIGKDINIISNGCEVRLNKTKYDVLKERDFTKQYPNPDELIKDYFRLKKELKTNPTYTNMEKLSKYSMTCYRNVFGSWRSFLIQIGQDKNYKFNNKPLIKEEFTNKFGIISSKLQPVPIPNGGWAPTLKQLNDNGISESQIRRLFGGYIKFLESRGYKHPQMLSLDKEYMDDYYNKKNKLGRIPFRKELSQKLNWHGFIKLFGSYKDFLIEKGEILSQKNYSKEQIINMYHLLKKEYAFLGRLPYCTEFYKFYNIKPFYIEKLFGKPFNKVLIEIGELTKYDFDTFKEMYIKLKNKLGKTPKASDFEKDCVSKHTIKRYCNLTWNNFIKECGDKPLLEHYSKKELIDNFTQLERKLGKIPTSQELDKLTNISYGTYANQFGSWDNFLKSMNRKTYFRRWNKENIIKEFYRIKTENNGCVSSIDNMSIMNAIKRIYGSWQDFLLEMKEYNYLFNLKNQSKKTKEIIKEILTKEYLDLKNKLGYNPSSKTMTKYNKHHCQTYARYFGSWDNFLKNMDITTTGKKEKYRIKIDDLKKEYERVKEKLQHEPTIKELDKYSKYSQTTYFKRFKSYTKFKEFCNKDNNIKIVSTYKPKTVIIPYKRNKKGSTKEYEWGGYHFKTGEDKIDIRKKIISQIQDGQKVLLLESPELSAIKEIELQNKKPSRIVIPNHLEFNKVAEALKGYNTKLNIELVNTSVLQYLIDNEERFDFMWLDYCGSFSYYMKDLDVLFAKNFDNIKLVLTYNLFDPVKEDDSYYFTRVIDYVLEKTNDKNNVRLLKDISYRYKKTMYNIGFDIKTKIVN